MFRGVPLHLWMIGALSLGGCDVGGVRSSYQARDYDPVLTRHARSAAPVFTAIEAEFRKTGRFPDPNTFATPTHIQYASDRSSYSVGIKLGWDPMLWYRSADGSWTFDPGDGGPEKRILLKAP